MVFATYGDRVNLIATTNKGKDHTTLPMRYTLTRYEIAATKHIIPL